jgi:hypothetical protein
MKPRRFAGPVLALTLLAFLPAALAAQEEGNEFRLSNFSLEFYGGYGQVNPLDLNNHASYEEAYLQFYFVKYYEYLHTLYGDNFTVASNRTGASPLSGLKTALPYGFRLRYQASPTFSLTVGIQYLRARQISDTAMTFAVQDTRPGLSDDARLRTVEYQNAGFTTEATAWMPELGAQFGWDLSAVFRWEINIAFGPIFNRCRTLGQRRVLVTNAEGELTDTLTATEMTGTVTGLSGEGGVGFFIRPQKNVRLFVQGGYIFRQLGEVAGPGWTRTTVSSADGVPTEMFESWSDKWFVVANNVTKAWGKFTPLSLQNRTDFQDGMRRFNPDLSGYQVKAGLGFNF